MDSNPELDSNPPQPATTPKLVLLFCGKRKSGKDFLTDWLQDHLRSNGERSTIVKLSGPIKSCYAETHGLDFNELMGDGLYKEKYRSDMVAWSEEIRNRDPGYFCRAAETMYAVSKYNVLIISDCRRKTDFDYFESNYPGRTRRVRIFASEESRAKRGFVFTRGIDDAETECGLDDTETDFSLENSDEADPAVVLRPVLEFFTSI